jgi:hypothetical protein
MDDVSRDSKVVECGCAELTPVEQTQLQNNRRPAENVCAARTKSARPARHLQLLGLLLAVAGLLGGLALVAGPEWDPASWEPGAAAGDTNPAAAGASPTGASAEQLSALGRNRYGVQGTHLNPLGLFLCASMPFIWSIVSAFLPV